MAGLLNRTSILMCPHGGMVQAITNNTRTMAAGDFVLRKSDTFLVTACPFVLGIVPHPCVQVQWVQPATQSQAASDFTLTEESVGLCVAPDMAVQGTVMIVFTQPRVAGR
jgi:hypothetical protein